MALLKSSQFSLVSLKSKRDSLGAEDGPVANVRRIVDLIRKDDPSFTGVDEKSPELVVNYLDQKLEDLEQDAPISDAPKLAQRLVKRIKGLMKVSWNVPLVALRHDYNTTCTSRVESNRPVRSSVLAASSKWTIPT